jgi:transcription elongation factor Elf1
MHKATDFECPFCGHGMAIDEPIEHDEEYETECWECKKPIIITACISTHYEAQCGHGHHDLIPSERHAGWVTCKRCDLFEKAESSVICNP